MNISGDLFKSRIYDHIMPVWYNYDDIIMKLEEEEEEEAEEIEDLKEKQKRLKQEMLKKRRIEKKQRKNGDPN